MFSGLLHMFADRFDQKTILNLLNDSSFDELVQIDLANNTCRNIYHVEGKFFVPVFDGSYLDLYRFSVGHMVHPDDLHDYTMLMHPATLLERLQVSETPGMLTATFRYKLQNGDWRWVQQIVIGGAGFDLPDGVVRFYVFDIQNQKERELGKMTSSSYLDGLPRDDKTGLLRDKAFFDAAKELLDEVEPFKWCIVSIDLDHFRLFNDWYGRDQGDMLLSGVGDLLRREEGESGGLAGYLGQDDFCMIMPFEQDAIERLHASVTAEVASFTNAIGFKTPFGVSVVDGETAFLDLFDRAKVALENARTNFKEVICFYEEEMQARTDKEYRVLYDFKEALRNGEFVAYLQPQCRLSTGKIVGVEALVRWCKPSGEIVPPLEFVPILEQHGFITDLDCYVWESVCSQVKDWIDSGHTAVPVSMNVSQMDIYTIDIAEHFCNLVENYGLDPSLVKVEITESAFADSASLVVDTVNRLRDAGFTVLMDDFGSGYSSLNMLSSLNVDVIKLDGEFLNLDETSRRKGIRIVESVINMTKTMALPIITEGVETKEQVEFLESLGVRYIQGFYFYEPMPIDEFKKVVADGTRLDERGFVAKTNEQMRMREFLDQNVYSDAMLNSILGPVAFYLWHDEDVDIIRFNEQFYEAVDTPTFKERLSGIQNMVPQREKRELYRLLEHAVEDDLNGAQGVVTFNKDDGSYARFWLHVYYLGETQEGKRFYASARDVTTVIELQRQMKVLSSYLSSTIIFVSFYEEAWHYEVVVHGLEDLLGISKEDLQRALADWSFVERFKEEDRVKLHELTVNAIQKSKSFTYSFFLPSRFGGVLSLRMNADIVDESAYHDKMFIVTLSER